MLKQTENGTNQAEASPEVLEKPVRRRFTAAYKLRIIEEADRCVGSGELGQLLRREGLYSSHLSNWRRLRKQGALQTLKPARRGRKPKPDSASTKNNAMTKKLEQLRRENQQLTERLRQAETIIEVQKKVSEIIGVSLPTPPNENSEGKNE